MKYVNEAERQQVAKLIANTVDNLISLGYPVEFTSYGIIIGNKDDEDLHRIKGI